MLSFIEPHKPVRPCTIARWLKTVMQASGIDVSVFKAHSTRSASSSKAHSQGVSSVEILKIADWSNQSTFSKFYKRETSKVQEFGASVLKL